MHCQYINVHSSHRFHTWLCYTEVQSGTALISFVNTVVVCVGVCTYVCIRPQEEKTRPLPHHSFSHHEETAELSLSLSRSSLSLPPLCIFCFLYISINLFPLPHVPLRFDVPELHPFMFQGLHPSVFLFSLTLKLCRTCLAVCSLLCLCV